MRKVVRIVSMLCIVGVLCASQFLGASSSFFDSFTQGIKKQMSRNKENKALTQKKPVLKTENKTSAPIKKLKVPGKKRLKYLPTAEDELIQEEKRLLKKEKQKRRTKERKRLKRKEKNERAKYLSDERESIRDRKTEKRIERELRRAEKEEKRAQRRKQQTKTNKAVSYAFDGFPGLQGQKIDVPAGGPKSDLKVTLTVPLQLAMRGNKLVAEPKMDRISSRIKDDGSWLYKSPTWPIFALPFDEKDMVVGALSYKHAGRAYSSNGHSYNISKLIFGEAPMCVKDILLASKLVKAGMISDYTYLNAKIGSGITADQITANNYLATMADQQLEFDAQEDELRFSIDYVRHFLKNHLSIGVHVPIVWKKHHISLDLCNTATLKFVKEKIQASTAFKNKYGDSFEEFFSDILASKNISFNTDDSELGIGDVELYMHWRIPTTDFERVTLGFKGLLPTARERNTKKLWDPELGNGGFPEISAFLSVLYGRDKLVNPHFFAQAAYRFSTDVFRRVPKCRKLSVGDLDSEQNLCHILAMGEEVRANDKQSFNELDTKFRRFATDDKKIKVRPGAEIWIRFGNMMEELVFRKGFGDMYYDIVIKGSDYVGKASCSDVDYRPSIITDNTFQTIHRFGLTYSYQFDKYLRIKSGATYIFAGRNVPREWGAHLILSGEF